MKRPDAGIILINVLVTLALGAAVVVLMFTSQERQVDRVRKSANAARAEALARGAEDSVKVALRRDMIVAPEADHYAEAWYATAQEEVELATGRFSVALSDARARFDLNSLSGGGFAQQMILQRLIAVLELPEGAAADIITWFLREGPQDSLSDVEVLAPDVRAALAPHVTFLKTQGGINVNTAGPVVLAAVLGNLTTARLAIQLRDEKGFLTKEDLQGMGIVALAGAGYTSDTYDAVISAEVDDTKTTLYARLLRRSLQDVPIVSVISRRFGDIAPVDFPDVPGIEVTEP